MATMPLGAEVRARRGRQDPRGRSRRRSRPATRRRTEDPDEDAIRVAARSGAGAGRRWSVAALGPRRPPARTTGEGRPARSAGRQDPKTLNPFVGLDEEELHDLGDQLGPARQLRSRGPLAGARHRRELGGLRGPARRSPSSSTRTRSGPTASRSPPRTSSGRSRCSAARARSSPATPATSPRSRRPTTTRW